MAWGPDPFQPTSGRLDFSLAAFYPSSERTPSPPAERLVALWPVKARKQQIGFRRSEGNDMTFWVGPALLLIPFSIGALAYSVNAPKTVILIVSALAAWLIGVCAEHPWGQRKSVDASAGEADG